MNRPHVLSKIKSAICKKQLCNSSTLYVVIVAFVIIFQIAHYIEFKNKITSFIGAGPRFTAQNGQDLCKSIQLIERELKLNVRDCSFYIEKK